MMTRLHRGCLGLLLPLQHGGIHHMLEAAVAPRRRRLLLRLLRGGIQRLRSRCLRCRLRLLRLLRASEFGAREKPVANLVPLLQCLLRCVVTFS